MDWEAIATISGITFFLGCVFLAAAKSIFVTQTEHDEAIKDLTCKLCDKHGVPIYLAKLDWEKSKNERDRRHDIVQRKLCEQMKDIQDSNLEIAKSLNNLFGRFDQAFPKGQ